MPRVLIAIATYNEIDNLPNLREEIRRHAPQAELLVVDDNSPDGTGRWCDAQAAADPRFHVLHRPGKLGLGTATIEAIRYATDNEYDLLVTMDADFSHPPHSLPELLRAMEPSGDPPCDVQIGSRYVRGGRIEGWPWRRRMMSRAVNRFARVWLGLSPRDCSGAFRCYRVASLRQVDLAGIRSPGYSFFEELLWRLQQQGARFAETPIVFVDRRHGQSKINPREACSALWILFRLGLVHWPQHLLGRGRRSGQANQQSGRFPERES